MFTNGQKVVCIDDDFSDAAKLLYKVLPVKNVTYTVRQVYLGRGNIFQKDSGKMDGEVGVLLVELVNPPDPALKAGLVRELGFRCERFAPLQTLPDEEETELTWEEIERRRYQHAPVEFA